MPKDHDQPLHLTTPHMLGERVSLLQKLLKDQGYYYGEVDGDFGVLTSQAVYRAKYALGYLNPDKIAGDLLFAYLLHNKEPSVRMRALGALRRRNAKKVSRGGQAVIEALKHLGTKESPPNSNRVSFSAWYGLVGAWCAMFVSYCNQKVGFTQFKAGSFVAYVPYLVNAAREGRNGLTVVHFSELRDGDIPCYDWDGDGEADHTGFYASETLLRQHAPTAFAVAVNQEGPLRGGDFWAVEGNTAFGNDSNGGEVMIRHRYVKNVQIFARAH